MMKRRTFLKLTGIAMARQALGAATLAGSPTASFGVPTASAAVLPPITSSRRLTITEPGDYQISGFVRLQSPSVQISGITNSQQISWSTEGPSPVVSFTSLESYVRGGASSEIQVLGGQIESVTITPVMS
jgi:hypothetical protein